MQIHASTLENSNYAKCAVLINKASTQDFGTYGSMSSICSCESVIRCSLA